jgi:hypothetical protein
MYHACPNKRGRNKDLNIRITTYAGIAAHGTPSRTESPENRTDGAQTPEQTNMTEGPMVETDEPTQTDRPHLSDDTTEQQTHQYPMLSLQGDSTEIATSEQVAEGQDLGDTMEGGEAIPETTPLHEQRSPMAQNPKDEIRTNKNVAIRHKAESKAGRSPEKADIEIVQIDEK